MHRILFFFILIVAATTGKTYAITWDEPWADKVIKEASSFVLARVTSCDAEKGISIQIIKTLSGKQLKDSLTITGFYLLDLCSKSGHGPEFHTIPIDSCYFFIRENQEGKYCIPTPTTGFDYVDKGRVSATYRHSYHQASVLVATYEKTMTAIFNNYHNQPLNKEFINRFVKEVLSKKPAGFSENEINTFFEQHVAMECVYHLRLKNVGDLIVPFLNDTANFHNQVSAARALAASDDDKVKEALMKVISDPSRGDFVKVMCIWTLGELNPVNFKSRLQLIEAGASDESNGFRSNLMDPRVCTHIPSVKKAVKELIDKL